MIDAARRRVQALYDHLRALRRDTERDRFPLVAVWLAALLVLAAVTFREISAFLLRIEGSSHAYGPSVYTGWNLKFWNTDDLMAAAGPGGVWSTNHELAGPFVGWHLTIDVAFSLILAWAFYRCLSAVSEVREDRTRMSRSPLVVVPPLVYLFTDQLETYWTSHVMDCWGRGLGCTFDISTTDAWVIHLLSDLKWLAVATNVLLILGCYFWGGGQGTVSWQRHKEFRWRLRKNRTRIIGPPTGAVVVVALLLVLLALPGGSALDQMPDVVRAQIDHLQDGRPSHAVWSGLSLVLFLLTLLVVVYPPLEPRLDLDNGAWLRVRSVVVLTLGTLTSVCLVLIHWHFEGAVDPPIGWAPGTIVWVVFGLAVATGGLRGVLREKQDTLDKQLRQVHFTMDDAVRVKTRHARLQAALLMGVVVLGAGLAVVRATLPLIMKEGDAEQAELTALVLAAVTAGALSVLSAWGLYRLFAGVPLLHRPRFVAAAVVVGLDLVLAARLAVAPERADGYGALATVVFALSAWMAVVAGFALMSRFVLWERTRELGLGPRTPWLALTMAVWLVAGVMDSSGGYHDTRTVALPDGISARSRTLDDAFRVWSAQFGTDRTEACDDLTAASGEAPANAVSTRKVPLVLVAAPGGGGKAAYWTALGMDRTFGQGGFCPQSLFVASGVSGGSVGLTAALAQPPSQGESEDISGQGRAEQPAEDAADDTADVAAGDRMTPEDAEDSVRRMTDEGPLSRTIASLLLRDLPQPFTAVRNQWRDRAAVLEDAWSDAAPRSTFGPGPLDPGSAESWLAALRGLLGLADKTLPELGDGWWTEGTGPLADRAASHRGPVLVLNGSSVNDGCRVLVSNASSFSSGTRGCLSAPIAAIDQAPGGAVSGSLDPLEQLLPSRASAEGESEEETDERYCAGEKGQPVPAAQTVRATTAALLFARFPYVTPAGAMRHCINLNDLNLSEESAINAAVIQNVRPVPGNKSGGESDVQKRLSSDTAYVVDGGYLENTGILTLLQIWEAVEPQVESCNAAAYADALVVMQGGDPTDRRDTGANTDGCPQDEAGHLWVEPWFVMLENHYRSRVVPALSTGRPAEIVAPIATARKKGTTLGTTPLEQAMALAVSRPYEGVPNDADPTVGSCNRFVRLAPLIQPVVEAPLGWVLADDTRRGMRTALEEAGSTT